MLPGGLSPKGDLMLWCWAGALKATSFFKDTKWDLLRNSVSALGTTKARH